MSDWVQSTADPQTRRSAPPNWYSKHLMRLCIFGGLAVVVSLAWATSMASADVDMTGAIEKASRLRSSLGGVESLATSANGDYKCTDKYSAVANWYYYYAIGNCPKGAEIEVV
jgi:hypothetical protein